MHQYWLSKLEINSGFVKLDFSGEFKPFNLHI